MKKYMPLNGLRWSRDSGSALCGTPPTDVLGQAGGGATLFQCQSTERKPAKVLYGKHSNCFFSRFFLNFPHNITIFALRCNQKANIR